MSKQAIPNNFELAGMIYKLAYFPNLKDATALLPDFSSMRIINQGFSEVSINNSKKYFIWKRSIIPATSMTPEKNFLMFAITDIYTQPDFIRPQEMIAYSIQPKEQADNLEQQFINRVFNIGNNEYNGAQSVKNGWADEIFTIEEKSEQKADVGVVKGNEKDGGDIVQ